MPSTFAEDFEGVEARNNGKFRDARGFRCAHELRDDPGDQDKRFHGVNGWRIVSGPSDRNAGNLGFTSYYVDSLGSSGTVFNRIGFGAPIGVERLITGEQAFALRMEHIYGYLFVCSQPVVMTAEAVVASARLYVAQAGWHEPSDELRVWADISHGPEPSMEAIVVFACVFGGLGVALSYVPATTHLQGPAVAIVMLLCAGLLAGVGVGVAWAAPNVAEFQSGAQHSLLPNCSDVVTRENVDVLGLRVSDPPGTAFGGAPFSAGDPALLNDTWHWRDLSASIGTLNDAAVRICVGLQSCAGAETVYVDRIQVSTFDSAGPAGKRTGADTASGDPMPPRCAASDVLVGVESFADLAVAGSCGGVDAGAAIAAVVMAVLVLLAVLFYFRASLAKCFERCEAKAILKSGYRVNIA